MRTAAGRAPVYVETSVRCAGPADAERLWFLTQDPQVHPRWDLRFSSITPTSVDGRGNRHFTYALALPFPRLPLRTVTGTGTSVGHRRDGSGRGTSALRFRTDDRLSPLGEGSGYWRYVPVGDGRMRFLTGYDYEPGWGRVGALLDPWLTRPAVGWATAWSFDRLRLWVDEGLDPALARDRALAWTALRALGVAGAAALARRSSWAAVGVAGLALLAPVPPSVPSGRRCLRRPPDPRAGRAPASLAGLPEPAPAPAGGGRAGGPA
ncbi:hypothetical protein [Kineococcus xinjiangensis]|uniref:hypothetical protein n=1 Tax=Kineococcus xinjiangensis TaxID=512762 RepID=UPI001B800461|nr:hypothetical protein [Kineococcus xinjiangensis]